MTITGGCRIKTKPRVCKLHFFAILLSWSLILEVNCNLSFQRSSCCRWAMHGSDELTFQNFKMWDSARKQQIWLWTKVSTMFTYRKSIKNCCVVVMCIGYWFALCSVGILSLLEGFHWSSKLCLPLQLFHLTKCFVPWSSCWNFFSLKFLRVNFQFLFF